MVKFFVVEARRDVAVIGPLYEREVALIYANEMNKQWRSCNGPRYTVESLPEEES